ncbi:GTP pyrophosphokinase [Vibrio natriegens]|uniref:GTP pyrophosphokinase n=1 Tax=Vibrio natriegens TaxID=691 RepID=UPI0008044377|nr:GTP pyrophosphokinase [Vibrio natriegens]ANQ16279.1 GTP pyrophosphokinase [Vibrio natriegens]
MSKYSEWADTILPAHKRLTDSAITIMRNLFNNNEIEILSVSGRTKEKSSLLEKISRKQYKKPNEQMTDISGVRVIVYFESDVKRVCEIIEQAFNIDEKNSSNQDDRLSINQIGYRSVHYVCDLGEGRALLPEFLDLDGLKFEVQVRTVLQHAWAELAHDRNYKFAGKLPPDIERNLYLYAGMLEIADKGFSQLSSQIDEYIEEVHEKNEEGNLDYILNTLSLKEFVENWADKNGIEIEHIPYKVDISDLILELEQFGVKTAEQLNQIIPQNYAEVSKEHDYTSTIFGLVRDWMLITDWRKFLEQVDFDWVLSTKYIYDIYFDTNELNEFIEAFPWDQTDDDFEELN